MRPWTTPRAALPRVAALVGLVAVLTAGCESSRSRQDSGNRPDPSPSQAQVVRTPSPIGTDLPYTDPPLVVVPPGATGGTVESNNPNPPEASPGESQDEGNDSPGN